MTAIAVKMGWNIGTWLKVFCIISEIVLFEGRQ